MTLHNTTLNGDMPSDRSTMTDFTMYHIFLRIVCAVHSQLHTAIPNTNTSYIYNVAAHVIHNHPRFTRLVILQHDFTNMFIITRLFLRNLYGPNLSTMENSQEDIFASLSAQKIMAGSRITQQPANDIEMTSPSAATIEQIQSPVMANTAAPFQDLWVSSEFTAWCIRKGVNPPAFSQFVAFLKQKTLMTSPCDPVEYPGFQHAVRMVSDCHAEADLSMEESTKYYLACQFAEEASRGKFAIGETLDDRWTVLGQLIGVEGHFNRDILLVSDRQDDVRRLMKLLPTQAIWPDFAARETEILGQMDHPNIVKCYAGQLGQGCHDTPWIVTEYCNAGALKKMLAQHINCNTKVVEYLVWHIFESLVRAVQYCHHGPATATQGDSNPIWDPVSHRDIILSNIFVMFNPAISTIDNLCTVKLGDFGCAVTNSEMSNNDLKLEDLAEEAPSYVPPEGAVPSEAADVYQVGLVLFCFYHNLLGPHEYSEKAVERAQKIGFQRYSEDLARFIYACIHNDPVKRPTATQLLVGIMEIRQNIKLKGFWSVNMDNETF